MITRCGFAAAILASALLAGAASAQEEEILGAPSAASATGEAKWSAFSRSSTSTFLIDSGGMRTHGNEIRVRVARVSLSGAAGDYSHVVDEFAVRCSDSQSHLVSSAEAYEDGEPTDAFDADEPWARVAEGSFDEAILEIGCGRATPAGDSFDSVKAYIDAGRP